MATNRPTSKGAILQHINHPHAKLVYGVISKLLRDAGAALVKQDQLTHHLTMAFFGQNPTDKKHHMECHNLVLAHSSKAKTGTVVLPVEFHTSELRQGLITLKEKALSIQQFFESEAFQSFEAVNAEEPYIGNDGYSSNKMKEALDVIKKSLLTLNEFCVVIPAEVVYVKEMGMRNMILPFSLNLIDELMDANPSMTFQVKFQIMSPAGLAEMLAKETKKE